MNRRILLAAALLVLPCVSLAWGQDCENPATAVGGNSSFTIELVGGEPTYDGDEVTFTYEVCQVDGQNALSHWIFVPNIDCYGADEDGFPYTLEDLVVGATIQTYNAETGQWVDGDVEIVVGLDPTTGLNGIKFDDLKPYDYCHRYTITFNVSKLEFGYTLCAGCVDAATKAGNEDIRNADSPDPGFASILGPVCCPIEVEECWEGETAWADGERYVNPGNWATYTAYNGVARVATLFAGQTLDAGTVFFSAPEDGLVTICIMLNEGFRFADDEENVKIQDYDEAPTGNPAPGQFQWKGTADQGDAMFWIVVPVNGFYGVHVDVERLVDCED